MNSTAKVIDFQLARTRSSKKGQNMVEMAFQISMPIICFNPFLAFAIGIPTHEVINVDFKFKRRVWCLCLQI